MKDSIEDNMNVKVSLVKGHVDLKNKNGEYMDERADQFWGAIVS